MSDEFRWHSVSRLLGQEAHFLDSGQWDAWLDLFEADVEYCVPAWDDNGVVTTDPKTELCLIYYKSRRGLEDRVTRVREGKSAASIPAPRSCHIFTLLGVRDLGGGIIAANTSWNATVVQGERRQVNSGSAEYELVDRAGRLTIKKKRTILINDSVHTVADFYSL